MTGSQRWEFVERNDEHRDINWLSDEQYSPDLETAVSLSLGSDETDRIGKSLSDFMDDLDSYVEDRGEREILGIDNHGRPVAYDGEMFLHFTPQSGYQKGREVEKDWAVEDPISHHVTDVAEEGPWITLTGNTYDKLIDQVSNLDAIDVPEGTIIDKHAVDRWSERGGSVWYDNVIDDIADAEVYQIDQGDERLNYFDVLRYNETSGLSYLQAGNRIVTTLPRIDQINDQNQRTSIRDHID